MKQIRLFFRVLFFACVLVVYFSIAFIFFCLSGFSFDRARHSLTELIAWTCRCGLTIFNIKVETNKKVDIDDKKVLIVANHLGYIDVLAISSLFPTSFVTSLEMKRTPFLGQLCQFGGCLFVDRKNRRKLGGEVEQLAEALKAKIPVTIFPEATSHNGEKIYPFRKPLFQAAINAEAAILPIVLNYTTLEGEPITLKNRDTVFWYGDMPFFSHAMKLFSQDELLVKITLLDFVSSKEKDKYALSSEVHELITAHYHPIT